MVSPHATAILHPQIKPEQHFTFSEVTTAPKHISTPYILHRYQARVLPFLFSQTFPTLTLSFFYLFYFFFKKIKLVSSNNWKNQTTAYTAAYMGGVTTTINNGSGVAQEVFFVYGGYDGTSVLNKFEIYGINNEGMPATKVVY